MYVFMYFCYFSCTSTATIASRSATNTNGRKKARRDDTNRIRQLRCRDPYATYASTCSTTSSSCYSSSYTCYTSSYTCCSNSSTSEATITSRPKSKWSSTSHESGRWSKASIKPRNSFTAASNGKSKRKRKS